MRFCHVYALIMAASPVAFAYLRARYIGSKDMCAARLQANGFIPRRIKEAQSASAIRRGRAARLAFGARDMQVRVAV